jgi:hypothetical protein
MATVTQKSELTLVELAKRLDPKGVVVEIAEVLEEENEILDDLKYIEANDVTQHTSTIRKLLPSGSFPGIGGYVAPEVSNARQTVEKIGMLEAYSQVPVKLVKLSSDPARTRKDEDKAFLQGLAITMAETFIYGKPSEAGAFPGLAERYNSLSQANVTSGGGVEADSKTSIWIVQHDLSLFHAVYPRGSKIGLAVDDLGESTDVNADGEMRQVYRSHFSWDMGIVVRDERAVQRIANIIVTDSSASFSAFDDLMIRALRRMPKRGKGAVIYANRDMMGMFDILAKDKSNVAYGSSEVFGREVTTFRGVPIRMVEAITSAEDLVA